MGHILQRDRISPVKGSQGLPITISEIMQGSIRVVGKYDTIAHARNILLRERLSRLVVIDKGVPVGVLTKKDILKALSNFRTRQRELDSIGINEVMRSPVIVIKEGASIKEAAQLMSSEGIRGLPVTDDRGALVGIITKTDLTRYFSDNYKGCYAVKDVVDLGKEPPMVHRTHTIYRVIDLMDELSTDRVIVVEENKPIGVITETDLSFVKPYRGEEPFFKGRKVEEREVKLTRVYALPIAEDIMTPDPLVIESTADAGAVAGKLIENGIGGMPIVDGHGMLLGIITKFDFVKALAAEVQ